MGPFSECSPAGNVALALAGEMAQSGAATAGRRSSGVVLLIVGAIVVSLAARAESSRCECPSHAPCSGGDHMHRLDEVDLLG